MQANQTPDHGAGHSHGAGVQPDLSTRGVLERGLSELLRLTEGLAFRPLASKRYPLPLALAVYGSTPQPAHVRDEVHSRMGTDPISALEAALVLLELYVSNQPGVSDGVPGDEAFLTQAFRTKRQNGWVALLGDCDTGEIEAQLEGQGRFVLLASQDRRTALYPLLNAVARYAFVYGRIAPGDSHALAHFTEDFAPGLVLCLGGLTEVECVLSLGAMKLGLPAVVPPDYPFSLGRQVRSASLTEIGASLSVFRNLHRLLDVPEIPPLPEYLSPEHARESFTPVARWGSTPESFYILRKGPVTVPGVDVTREQVEGGSVPMGVILTVDAEPLDAFDRRHVETRAARALSTMRGVSAKVEGRRLVIELDKDIQLSPRRVGEALIAAIRHESPKIERIRATIILERWRLNEMVMDISAEHNARCREIEEATEETVDTFATCVGCSPFAPDHVCILTPERSPQCGRTFETIQAGARYSYDDMSAIHHRVLHSGINSFGACPKGTLLDSEAGEWSGVNEAAARLTGGRTTRIQLHSLDEAPHTGCGCFRLVMFKLDPPGSGIGIMERGYQGPAPGGKTWADLHYALAGKQAPGIAGASPDYLRSTKFLAAHGGWDSVTWVSPKIGTWMRKALPKGVQVGPQVDSAKGD